MSAIIGAIRIASLPSTTPASFLALSLPPEQMRKTGGGSIPSSLYAADPDREPRAESESRSDFYITNGLSEFFDLIFTHLLHQRGELGRVCCNEHLYGCNRILGSIHSSFEPVKLLGREALRNCDNRRLQDRLSQLFDDLLLGVLGQHSNIQLFNHLVKS